MRFSAAPRTRWASNAQRPGLTIVILGFLVCAASGALELLNPGNYWVLFEDVSCAVAPTAAAVA